MKNQAPPTRRPRPKRAAPAQTRNRRKKPPLDPDKKIRKRGNVYYVFEKTERRIPVRLIASLVMVLIVGLGMAYTFALQYGIQSEIAEARDELRDIMWENRYMEVQQSERFTREQIETRAYELGMREPDASQIIYVNFERVNRVEIATYEPVVQPENYFWQGVVAFFSRIRDWFAG